MHGTRNTEHGTRNTISRFVDNVLPTSETLRPLHSFSARKMESFMNEQTRFTQVRCSFSILVPVSARESRRFCQEPKRGCTSASATKLSAMNSMVIGYFSCPGRGHHRNQGGGVVCLDGEFGQTRVKTNFEHHQRHQHRCSRESDTKK